MSSVNKVILVGNLGRDDMVRYMPRAMTVAGVVVDAQMEWVPFLALRPVSRPSATVKVLNGHQFLPVQRGAGKGLYGLLGWFRGLAEYHFFTNRMRMRRHPSHCTEIPRCLGFVVAPKQMLAKR